MKVLIDHHEPFLLAHGGLQIQIARTLQALNENGIQAKELRWWENPSELPDLIHFFGLPSIHYVRRAKAKGIQVVVTYLLTNTCNRRPLALWFQAAATRLLTAGPLGKHISDRLGWTSLREADAIVVGLSIEKEILRDVWGVDNRRIWQVPLGTGKEFFPSGQHKAIKRVRKERYLITVGTICSRKCSVALANLADEAQVPIVFVGKPIAENDHEWISFQHALQSKWVTLHPHVNDPVELAKLYRGAVGFVHFSDGENWCLAAHEAKACGIPLLVRDQPWSRERFKEGGVVFWKYPNVKDLKSFYLTPPVSLEAKQSSLSSWQAAVRVLIDNYRALQSRSVQTCAA